MIFQSLIETEVFDSFDFIDAFVEENDKNCIELLLLSAG